MAYLSSLGVSYPPTLKLLNVTTGAVTSLGVMAGSPRWAPQGQRIAYVTSDDKVNVIQADGSNPHVVNPTGSFYEDGIDWSPDGQWIVAVNVLTGHADLINATSGVVLPLGFTQNIHTPTWRSVTH